MLRGDICTLHYNITCIHLWRRLEVLECTPPPKLMRLHTFNTWLLLTINFNGSSKSVLCGVWCSCSAEDAFWDLVLPLAHLARLTYMSAKASSMLHVWRFQSRFRCRSGSGFLWKLYITLKCFSTYYSSPGTSYSVHLVEYCNFKTESYLLSCRCSDQLINLINLNQFSKHEKWQTDSVTSGNHCCICLWQATKAFSP